MATWQKFQDYSEQLHKGQHDYVNATYKVALTNTAPVNTQTTIDLVTNHPPPAAANGYTDGGHAVTIAISETNGVTTVTGEQVVITANAAGGIGPFRYVVLYNDTTDQVQSFSDYGSSITLQNAETFTIKFNNASPGTIFTHS